ncbi:MAG: hypothetical protein ACRD29_03615 [Acidimicrobiales bacterium]
MQIRNLVLVLCALALISGLVLLLVPRTVQTGSPFLGQVRDEATTGEFSCGVPIGYAFGTRPWEEDNPVTYQRGQFIPVSEECPGRLRSNLGLGIFWTVVGAAALVARYLVVRRFDRKPKANVR